MLNPKSPKGHTAWDYGDTVLSLLDSIKEAIEDGNGDEPEIRRIPFTIQCDATGAGTVGLPVPLGKSWELMSIGFSSSVNGGTGGNAHLLVFANEVDPRSLVGGDAFNGQLLGTFNTMTFDGSVIVTPEDSKVVLQTGQQDANFLLSGNLRVRQFDTNPNSPKSAKG